MDTIKVYNNYLSPQNRFAYQLISTSPSIWTLNLSGSYFPVVNNIGVYNPSIDILSGVLVNSALVNQTISVRAKNIGSYTNSVLRIYSSNDNVTFSEIANLVTSDNIQILTKNTPAQYIIIVLEWNGKVLYSTKDIEVGYTAISEKIQTTVYRKNTDGSRYILGVYPVFRDTDNNMVVDLSYRTLYSYKSNTIYTIDSLTNASLENFDSTLNTYVQIGGNNTTYNLPVDYFVPVDNVFSITNGSVASTMSLETLVEAIIFWAKNTGITTQGSTVFLGLMNQLSTLPRSNGLFFDIYNRETGLPTTTTTSVYANLYLATRFLSSNIPSLVSWLSTNDGLGKNFIDYLLLLVDNVPASPSYSFIADGFISNAIQKQYLLKNQILLYTLYTYLNSSSFNLAATQLSNNIGVSYISNPNAIIFSLVNNIAYIPSSIEYALLLYFATLNNKLAVITSATSYLLTYQYTNSSGISLNSDISNPSYNIHYSLTFLSPLVGFKEYISDNGISMKATLFVLGLVSNSTFIQNIENMLTTDGVLNTDVGTPSKQIYVLPSLFDTLLFSNIKLSNNHMFNSAINISTTLSSNPIAINLAQYPTSTGLVAEINLSSPSSIVVYVYSPNLNKVYDIKFIQGNVTNYTVSLNAPKGVSDLTITVLPVLA